MGRGVLNPAYIDNLVDGIALAVGRDEGAGQVFTIADGVAVSTREFFEHYGRLLGRKVRVAPTPVVRALAAVASRLPGDEGELNAAAIAYIARGGTYSIEKARTVLGYEPAVGLRGGHAADGGLAACGGLRRMMPPGPEELRVLGCLIEKQRTTPDAYPLSVNALRLACNQSTNRDPVVDWDERTVRTAAQRLGERGWARFTSGAGSRAAKYRHVFDSALGLSPGETAVLAVLMLRGPQTPGRAEGPHRPDARLRLARRGAGDPGGADRAVSSSRRSRGGRGRRSSATCRCSVVTTRGGGRGPPGRGSAGRDGRTVARGARGPPRTRGRRAARGARRLAKPRHPLLGGRVARPEAREAPARLRLGAGEALVGGGKRSGIAPARREASASNSEMREARAASSSPTQ